MTPLLDNNVVLCPEPLWSRALATTATLETGVSTVTEKILPAIIIKPRAVWISLRCRLSTSKKQLWTNRILYKWMVAAMSHGDIISLWSRMCLVGVVIVKPFVWSKIRYSLADNSLGSVNFFLSTPCSLFGQLFSKVTMNEFKRATRYEYYHDTMNIPRECSAWLVATKDARR